MSERAKVKELNLALGEVTEKIIEQVKVLNGAIFPVKYNSSFYQRLVSKPDLSRLAYYSIDILVGGVSWNVEKKKDKEAKGQRLYIMTLGVLAPYRNIGIGSKLLKSVLDYAHSIPQIDEVYLHVQINNENALKFYQKYGFTVTDTIKDYYKKIEPADCHVLTKAISHSSPAQ